MAVIKKFNAAVKVGEYQQDGKTKNRYVTVGSVMESDDGSLFLLMDRTFNPAGVPNPDGRPNVAVGFFTPQQGGNGDAQQQPTQRRQQPAKQDNFEDDIPF